MTGLGSGSPALMITLKIDSCITTCVYTVLLYALSCLVLISILQDKHNHSVSTIKETSSEGLLRPRSCSNKRRSPVSKASVVFQAQVSYH